MTPTAARQSAHRLLPVPGSFTSAFAREAELACYQAFPVRTPAEAGDPGERADLKQALNRLSSAFYVMQCRFVGGHYGVSKKPGPLRGWKPPAKSA